MKANTLVLVICILFLQGIYCKLQSSTFSTVSGGVSITANFLGTNLVSSSSDNVIYQIDGQTGETSVFAGSGSAGYKDGNVLDAQFNKPMGIAMSYFGDLYVCDNGNNAIRKVSQGVVSTVAQNIQEPIQIVVQAIGYQAYQFGDEYAAAPVGIYVVTANGQVILLDDSPANDICEFAIDLGTISSVSTVQGTTKQARNQYLGHCSLPYPSEYDTTVYTGVWYTFNGDGNQYTISNCFSETDSGNTVLVYRDSDPGIAKCTSLTCMNATALHQNGCLHAGGTVAVCTQPNITYYVFVGVENSFSAPTDFQLQITNLGSENCADCVCGTGLVRECGMNQCDGYCSNYCPDGEVCSIDSLCVEAPANSQCTGAIPLTSTQQVGNLTQNSVASAISAVGSCRGRNQKLPGYWYTFQGTGTKVNVSTCGGNTNRNSIFPYLYQQIEGIPCNDNLICPPFASIECNNNQLGHALTVCTVEGTTYYVYVSVDTYDLPKHATFGVSVLDSGVECTPGDLHYEYTSFWYEIEEF